MLVTEDNKHIMLEALSRERFFALDTETTGLEWTDKPFALVVATESQTFYTEHVHIIRELFDVPCTVIMANAKFDMRMIGLPFYSCWNIRDISIFERILSNDAPSIASYSLDAISRKRLGLSKSTLVDEYIKEHGLYDIRKTKYTQEEYKLPRFDKVPRDILQRYAELDARLTYDCYKSQVISATSDDIKVFENECKLLHATYKMEMEGILLDSTYTENALLYESSLLGKAKENFSSIIGKPYENKKSLLIPLFENSGEKIQYTPKGNPRLTDDDLESYTSPAARLVQQIRYHEKRISTYFTNYLDLVDDNNLIHPSILQHGTKTGRFSYAAPNCQNLPKDEPEENPYCVRGCFVPEEGNIFLSLDYSQQEYRLMLDYAGEMKVIREVMGGKDLHQAIADAIGITRKQAKTLNFACIAEGNLVLTDSGLVPIEKVTLNMRLWDGIAWVNHAGVIYNGEKEVISYAGLTATRDHIVFTEEEGEVSFERAIDRKLSLVVSGDKRTPIRISYDNFRCIQRRKISKGISNMCTMLWEFLHISIKYNRGKDYRLSMSTRSDPQSMHINIQALDAVQKMDSNSTTMPKQKMQSIPFIWRTWNTLENVTRGIYGVLHAIFRGRLKDLADRQNRQQWALRNRQHKICSSQNKSEEYSEEQALFLQRKGYSSRRSAREINKGLYRIQLEQGENDKIGAHGSPIRGYTFEKTKRKVYDIVNSGPRNRFTVSGRLVHNCLYGSGANKIAEMLGISEKEARKLKENYLRALPRVDKLIADVISKNRQRGYVRNWFGRVLRNTYDNSYKAPNHLIQGGCGDIIKVAMVQIHDILKGSGIKMRLQVHDQLVFEGHREELLHKYAEICMIMQSIYPSKNGIVLTTDASFSTTSFAERDMQKWEMI